MIQRKKFVNESGINGTAVGFYGIDASAAQIEAFFRAALRWFERKKLEPQFLSLGGAGFPMNKRTSPKFLKGQQLLAKQGFARVEALGISCYSFDVCNQRRYADLEAGFVAQLDVSLVARNEIEALSHEFLFATVTDIIQIMQPECGIGFRRDLGLGPANFIAGVVEGLDETINEEEDECAAIGGWWEYGIGEKAWRHGVLRDVYPWNFLTAPQLNAKIDNQTLAEWIRCDPAKRGNLIPIAHMQLWEVPEAVIAEVRAVLWANGRILDYRKREKEWEQSLKDYPHVTREQALGKVLDAYEVESPDEMVVFDTQDPKRPRRLPRKKIGEILKVEKSKRLKKDP